MIAPLLILSFVAEHWLFIIVIIMRKLVYSTKLMALTDFSFLEGTAPMGT